MLGVLFQDTRQDLGWESELGSARDGDETNATAARAVSQHAAIMNDAKMQLLGKKKREVNFISVS